MIAREYAELTTTELPDELQFTVVCRGNWVIGIFRMLLPIAPLSFILFAPSPHFSWGIRIVLLLFCLIWVSSMNLSWVHGGTTTLRVTSSGLVAAGNLGKLFSTRATMPASEVAWLGFSYLQGVADGLSIESAETDIYVPGLNREQAEAVAHKIMQRFPNIRSDFPR
jgi:hypothetical protein